MFLSPSPASSPPDSVAPPLSVPEGSGQGEGFSIVHSELVNFHCREIGDPLSHSLRQKKTAVSAGGGCVRVCVCVRGMHCQLRRGTSNVSPKLNGSKHLVMRECMRS